MFFSFFGFFTVNSLCGVGQMDSSFGVVLVVFPLITATFCFGGS